MKPTGAILLLLAVANRVAAEINAKWLQQQSDLQFAASGFAVSNTSRHLYNREESSKRDYTSTSIKKRGSSLQFTDFMTTCQYKIILKITSFFENSNLNLDFGSCSTTNDGQGISAGFIQFTTCSGSAALVCREYQRLKSGPTFCDSYLPSLDHAANSCQGGNWGQQTPAGLENFCYDWRTASTDTIFQQAQLNVQFSGYFKPAMDIFTQYGVKSPLTMGQVYDACVQLGCSAAATLADRASRYAGGSPAGSNPVSEDRWLNAYLIQRESYLDFLGGAYAATKYRVRAYFSMQTNPTFVNDWVVMNVLYDNGSTDRETITC